MNARLLAALGLVVAGAVVLGGPVPEYRANEWTLWLILGLLALSFAFVWGHAGIFSFGQAAFFGIGGYAYSLAGVNLINTTGETMSAVFIGVAVAALFAALLGYFLFWGNVGDVYLAIITLATSLVLLTIMGSTAGDEYKIGDAALGGYNGVPGVPPLSYGEPGALSTPLTINEMLVAVFVIAALVTLGLAVLLRRPFGRVVAAVRENELRTELLGYDVRRYKLAVFVLGGAIAGLAGALYAAWGTFINPSVFSLSQAALVAIYVLVGGRTSLVGAFAGVILIELLTSELGGSGGTATPIVLGAVLIAIVLFLPEGLVPSLRGVAERFAPRLRPSPLELPAPGGAGAPGAAPIGRDGGKVLEATDLRKAFGGVVALDGVSLRFPTRGVHCLIGPNGAGKSTFFNLLVGRFKPTAGSVALDGATITRRRPDERARLGVGIKLQVPSLYDGLTTFENVWLAAFARTRDRRAATERAAALLDWLGMRDRAADRAGALPHGGHQWLEIGMALAQTPDVVLLDEPTAGMGREETSRAADLVKQIGEHAAVIVVAHDMEFVRQLDAPVTMLHEGKLFAQGSIEELRSDERVLDIYLGRATSDAAA